MAKEDDSTIGGPNSAYWGMEPYVRTPITDRAHDGIYDIDTAHKTTLASRVKSGMVPSPHISRNEKQLTGEGGREVRHGVRKACMHCFGTTSTHLNKSCTPTTTTATSTVAPNLCRRNEPQKYKCECIKNDGAVTWR